MTIEQLQNKKSTLLSEFDAMSKQHSKLYSNIDISQEKSQEEKISEKAKADLYSEINSIVREIRNLKTKFMRKINSNFIFRVLSVHFILWKRNKTKNIAMRSD